MLLQVDALVVGHKSALLPAVTVQIHAGECWGIVGRNGSGKTTLLRTLLGLTAPMSGAVHRARDLRVSYVAQRSEIQNNVPARVYDIVADGEDRGWSFWRYRTTKSMAQRVRDALARVDAEALAQRPFARLSEGQKQRVLLARALISQPNLLVLDEPTSAMDITGEHAMLELLTRTSASQPVAVMVVGHHIAALAASATHLMVVDADDAVVCCGRKSDVTGDARVRHLF